MLLNLSNDSHPSDVELVDLGGENKIVLAQAADGVSPDLDRHVLVAAITTHYGDTAVEEETSKQHG